MRQQHRARRLALQSICCLDVRGPGVWEMIDLFLADSRETPQTTAAARELAVATFDSLQQIDRLLTRHASGWRRASFSAG